MYRSGCVLVVMNMVRSVSAQRQDATGGDLARNLSVSAVLTSLTNTFRFACPQIPAKVDESTTIGQLVEARHWKVTDSVRADGELSFAHFSFFTNFISTTIPFEHYKYGPCTFLYFNIY